MIMILREPSPFVTKSSREHALLHWQNNNHLSIIEKLAKTMKAMNKLDQYNCVIPLLSWIARLIPHTFFTPHHLLQKEGKKD